MTREEAKRRAELYSALAGGKTIQILNMEGNWIDVEVKKLNYIPETLKFRIKPEPKYRPFKTQEECWQEMHQHPDFGWVLAKDSKIMYHICVVGFGYVLIDSMSPIFSEAFAEYKFTDGTPFGIKEEQYGSYAQKDR